MKYVLLIYTDQAALESVPPQTGYHTTYAESPSAVVIAAEALHPISVATTIRVRSGKTLITDGAATEATDQLSGYYILDCLDEEVAAQWAASHPDLRDGVIEIRPALIMPNLDVNAD
jgi:hypothetical protein